jgi:hypothetical protein
MAAIYRACGPMRIYARTQSGRSGPWCVRISSPSLCRFQAAVGTEERYRPLDHLVDVRSRVKCGGRGERPVGRALLRVCGSKRTLAEEGRTATLQPGPAGCCQPFTGGDHSSP